jgi:D-3-phosphoglycerate dehydrogenase
MYLKANFERITLAPLTSSLGQLDTSDVTDWIVDPAPAFEINKLLVEKNFPSLKNLASPSTGTTQLSAELVESAAPNVFCLRDIPQEKLDNITSSSEHTFFLFLCLLRRAKHLFSADLSCWRDCLPVFRGRQAKGMQAFIFGYGRIGKNLAGYLEAMGVQVSIYEPNYRKHTEHYKFVERGAIPSMLSTTNVVFLCFHWSGENNRFFGRHFLDLMQDDAFFVNTSRGENLDQEHLAFLLRRGKFSGVALDVLANEQQHGFRDSELIVLERHIDRLVITPHVAGASRDSEALAFEYMVEKLIQLR